MRRIVPFLCLAACFAFAQGRVNLQILVALEGEQQPYDKPITVTLMNEWNEPESAQTTSHGMVQFYTRPGVHTITVAGNEIEMLREEFTLDRLPGGTQVFHVRLKATVSVTSNVAEAAPLVRLRIPGKAKSEFHKAQKAWEKRDWNQVRAHLEKAISFYPDYDLAYCALGDLDLAAGQREAARLNLQKAISLNDRYADAQRKLAGIYLAEKKYREAEALLLKSLNTEPQNVWALSFAALAELMQGKPEEALLKARRVHAMPHRDYASAHLIAAQALEGTHRAAEALAEYRLYLSEDPTGPNVQRAQEAVQRIAAANPKR